MCGISVCQSQKHATGDSPECIEKHVIFVRRSFVNFSSATDVCDTKLPSRMPPVGLQDITNKYTSLVPTLTSFNIIPGYVDM